MRKKFVSVLVFMALTAFGAAQQIDFRAAVGSHKIRAGLQGKMQKAVPGAKLRVIVNLQSVEDEAGKKAAYGSEAAFEQMKRNIAQRQDRVIAKLERKGSLTVLNHYQTIYAFSAEADVEAILELAKIAEVEVIEEMPVFQKMDAESHALANVTAVHTQGYTGSGVTIAIIDDGIDHDHAAFGGSTAWPNAKILGGYDFADNDSNPRIDCTAQSHGTAVSGVAAGNGGGVLGTAPDAKLVVLKVQKASECGQGTLSGDVAAAIDWAVANRATYGIKIISMSLGGGAYSSASTCNAASTAYTNAVNSAYNAGMVVLAASGNEGLCSQISHPACLSNVISVGAVYDANVGGPGYCVSASACVSQANSSCTPGRACFDTATFADKVTCYSNSASFLDILAPSNCATTALAGGGTNTCFGGTSSATPFAAGVAATLLQANPSLNNDTMRALLVNNGVGVLDSKNNITKPRIDANASLQATLGGGAPISLTRGVPVTNLSASTGNELKYVLAVPSGATNLTFQISGGTGDADLYVKFGSQPTTSSYDCRPYLNGNNETCTFASPSVGNYYVTVRAYSTFSGVTLVGNYDLGGGAPCTGCTQYTGSLSGTNDYDYHPNGSYYYSSTSGTHEGWLEGPAGTDFDLRLQKWNGSSWVQVATSLSGTSSEHITYSGTAGYYRYRIESYSGSGSYTHWEKRP